MSNRQGIAAGAKRLTETQRQCLRLTYRHMTSKEIAPLLSLSPHSVDAHIRIAMKVLGVDSRRDAAIALNEIESDQPARRKTVAKDYEPVDAAPYVHASEEPALPWTYLSDRSNMVASQKHSRNNSAMDAQVEQSGSTGVVLEPKLRERHPRLKSWSNPIDYTTNKKIVIILLTALLSAMVFSTIVSGIAAMSLLVTGKGSAN